ncbi:MAG TPA: hypothetical protein VFW92_01320 [Candidatus Limnocylindrales bacterium]|nr:hypothetical protein [Candidatus Limnocylindrales bacterium]
MHRPRILTAIVLAAMLAAACGPGGGASPSPTAGAGRPSSPAVIAVVEPTQGQVVTGDTVHVVVSLQNAKVVDTTSTHIVPTEGHVHLYLDNALVYMQYSLQQDLPVKPGTYTLRAEFVAADHAPFDPRVFSPQVIFTVK